MSKTCILYIRHTTFVLHFKSRRGRNLETGYWRIGQFAELVGNHRNTVDNWFKELEERRLHYISRVNNEKVYDDLDLQVAKFIKERRNKKWSIEGIFSILPEKIALRPFPTDFEEKEKTIQLVDVEKIRAAIISEMKTSFEEIVTVQVKEQMNSLQKSLPSPEQQRLERFNMLIAERRVKRRLEDEALSIWERMPEEERLIKIGFFRKIENIDKREHFVKTYIDERFEEEIKKEFGFD